MEIFKRLSTKSESRKTSLCSEGDDDTMVVIRGVWAKYILADEEFFYRTLLAAAVRCPGIAVTLGLPDPQNLSGGEKKYLRMKAEKVKGFLSDTIQLPEDAAKEAAFDLGAKHVDYSPRKFATVYWDVFVLSMTGSMEELNPRPSHRAIYAWQRFLVHLVDEMRAGYTVKETKRPSPRGPTGNSANGH